MNASEKLGVNQEELAVKCTEFTTEFLKETIFEKETDIVKFGDMIKETFTEKELIVMSFSWLAEKAEIIIDAYAKGKTPEEVIDTIKERSKSK
jgi:hypothetical protein